MQNPALLAALTRFRPAPAKVLLVGATGPELVAGLEAEGYELLDRTDEHASSSADAIMVVDLDAPSTSSLAKNLDDLRSRLASDGVLVLLADLAWGEHRPDDSLPAAELIAQLYERGFSLLERRVHETGARPGDVPPLFRGGPLRREVLVARREPYRVRGFGAGDEKLVLDLFHEAFPHDRRSLVHWLWKYRDHPDGGPFLSLAVDGDGRIGAHYAGYPIRFRDHQGGQTRSFEAFQIGDTMTAKWAHGVGGRRTSLLARATQHFFNRHCAHRIGFNFGFNTGKIHRFYMRIVPGSEYLEAVTERSAEVGALRIGAPGWWQRRVAGLEVTRETAVDSSWDELFERAAPAYGLLAERDSRHLRWRYFDHPDKNYLVLGARRRGQLVGWGVFRREGEKLIWGDALFEARHALDLRYLLHAALREPEAQGVQSIEGWFPERPAFWDRLLTELGFESRPEPRDLALIFMEFEERDLMARFEDRLYYTLGESDLF